jgi:anti-sigma28 factor (negative regulator of flagellin synthesis)
MNYDAKIPTAAPDDASSESVEERARRVAEIKRRIARGNYRVDSREIIYNMMKTAP